MLFSLEYKTVAIISTMDPNFTLDYIRGPFICVDIINKQKCVEKRKLYLYIIMARPGIHNALFSCTTCPYSGVNVQLNRFLAKRLGADDSRQLCIGFRWLKKQK